MKHRATLFLLVIFLIGTNSLFAQDQGEFNSGFEWSTLADAQVEAKESGKKILLFGYAEWCTYCLKTRKETFPDSTVLNSIAEYFIPVQLDAESSENVMFNNKTMQEQELARYLRLTSFPIHYFIDEEGEILGAQPGFIDAEVYAPLLNYVGSGAFGQMGFEEFLEAEGKSQ